MSEPVLAEVERITSGINALFRKASTSEDGIWFAEDPGLALESALEGGDPNERMDALEVIEEQGLHLQRDWIMLVMSKRDDPSEAIWDTIEGLIRQHHQHRAKGHEGHAGSAKG